MSIIYVLVPLAAGLAIAGVIAFIWAVRSRQFEDLDSAPLRMLFDEEEENGDQGSRIGDREG